MWDVDVVDLFLICSTAPITDRKQLNIISEAKLNAQAAQIYEKVKKRKTY